MQCIYCKGDSSTSVRTAHIAPQALVPTDVHLPLGAECDPCNEYAGKLETAFIHHNRIWPILMLAGVPGKKGRPRKRLGHLERHGDTLHLIHFDKIQFNKDGRIHVHTTADPPEYDNLKFRRGLHHMAFNYLAWKRGTDHVLSSELDDVRRYVRYAKRGESWPYAQVMYPDNAPNKELRLTLMRAAPGCVVRFISFLDEFYVDLLNTGQLHQWAEQTLPEGVGLL